MITAAIGLAILLALLLVGIPLGLGMFLVGFFGFAAVHARGFRSSFSVAGQQMMDLALNYNFSVLPLFVLMGVFVARAALSDDLFDAAQKWLGHMKGGLALSTVAACAGFAAVSGSSAATAATMTKAAMPSMRRHGYADWLSTGTLASGGTIGVLIPPSAALIIFGLLTEQDIGKLFMAGVGPGILTLVLYFAVIQIVTRLFPGVGPSAERWSWADRLHALGKTWGVVVLFILVLGGLFLGVFTPTEAGGIGAVGALLFAILRRKMSVRIFVDSLIEAAETTAMIFAVAFGALVLNQFINLSGMPEDLLEILSRYEASPMMVVFLIIIAYIILGMFLDGMSMIFLTVPIFAPVVMHLDFSMDDTLIWWGIVTVMMVEISLITPPVGMNVFIIKAMLPEVPLSSIFKGIAPFFIADVIRLAVLLILPSVALWLPGVMF